MENKRVLILTQMWLAGATAEAIGNRFGVASGTVYKWVHKYKLPQRDKLAEGLYDDPTPEHIEHMKAVLKARHLEERRSEDLSSTQSKVSKWRRNVCQPKGVRA